jgi:adenosyl cobinamide kinase/adenosyl cobinamide phosphate guanylyltransferase
VTLVVVLGGARSGKSALAVRLAAADGGLVTFLATGEARDEEMAARIAAHRAERPAGWKTVEEPHALAPAIERAPAGVLVVDCLSLWVANELERSSPAEIERAGADAAALARDRDGLTIAVSNEVGLGIVPATELGRVFRDVLGRVNTAWVAASTRAYLVVAGRALDLKELA